MNAALLKIFLSFFFGVTNVAPITGTGATVQISTSQARANWIQVIAASGNSAAVMFGDSTTTSTTGLPVAAGGGYSTPTCGQCFYVPASHYVYIANNDKAYIAYGY
jgi:hypothetical protein